MGEPVEIQLARVDEQLKALRQIVESARYIADIASKNSARLEVHEERFTELRVDVAQLEGRMEAAVTRVEKSCNDLGGLIRKQQEALSKVENEQDQQKQALTKREKYLLILAAAFASGAVGLLMERLG